MIPVPEGGNGRPDCFVRFAAGLSRARSCRSGGVCHVGRGRALGDFDDVFVYVGEPFCSDAKRLDCDGAAGISNARSDRDSHWISGNLRGDWIVGSRHATVGGMGTDSAAHRDVSGERKCRDARDPIAGQERDTALGTIADANHVHRVDMAGRSARVGLRQAFDTDELFKRVNDLDEVFLSFHNGVNIFVGARSFVENLRAFVAFDSLRGLDVIFDSEGF